MFLIDLVMIESDKSKLVSSFLRKLSGELLPVLFFAVILFIFAGAFDFTDVLQTALNQYEKWELDEVITVGAACFFLMLAIYILKSRKAQIQQMELERSIQKSRQISGILNNLPEAIVVTDLNNIITYCNVQAGDILGFEDIQGRDWNQLFGNGQHDSPAESANGAKRGKTESYSFFRIIENRNREILLSISRTLIKDAKDEVIGFLYRIRDVSAQPLAENDITRIAERTSLGVTVFDNQRLVYANSSFGMMLGYDGNESNQWLNDDSIKIINEEERSILEANMRKISYTNTPGGRFKVKLLHRNGVGVMTEVSLEPCLWKGNPGVMGFFNDITEYENRIGQLLEEVKDIKELIAATPCATVRLFAPERMSKIYCFTYVSENLKELTGIDSSMIMEDSSVMFDRIKEEDRELLTEGLRESAEYLTPFDMDIRIKGRRGKTEWIRFIASPRLSDRNGVIWNGSLVNISRLKESELTLKENYERLNMLLECSEDIIELHDLEGRYLYCNSPRKLGLKSEDLLGKTPVDVFGNETGHRLLEQLQEAATSGKSIEIENQISREGELLWFSELIHPIVDGNEGVTGVARISRNITKPKRAEIAIEKERRKLISLFEAIPAYINLLSNDYTISYANYKFRELFGDPEDKLCYNILHGRSKPCEYCPTFEVFETEIPKLWEWTNEDGKTFIIHDIPFSDDERPQVLQLGIDITERKKVENRLRESETKFNEIASNIEDGFWLESIETGRSRRIVYCNPALEKLLGKKAEELYRSETAWLDVIHPEDRERVVADLEKSLELKRGNSFEHRIIQPDGCTRWLSTKLSFIENDAGEKYRMVVAVRDITDRKISAENISRERERAQTYFNSAKVILVALDSEGCISQINEEGCSVLGYTHEELLGSNWFDNYLVSHEREDIKNIFKNLMGGSLTGFERTEGFVVGKDKKHRLIAWHNTLLKDDRGRIIGTLCSGEDITEKREAEEALMRSEQRFRTLFEKSSDALFLLDYDGNIREVNNQACKSLGYSKEELLESQIEDVFAEELPMEAKKLVFQGESGNVEFTSRHRKRTGASFPVDVKIVFLEYVSDTVICLSARDISQRRRAEVEREKLIDELKDALEHVKTLRGIIPICSVCKKIRDDEGYWNQLEAYIKDHSEAQFTHGICPECARKHYPDFYNG